LWNVLPFVLADRALRRGRLRRRILGAAGCADEGVHIELLVQ
jgi:hypothetical protein